MSSLRLRFVSLRERTQYSKQSPLDRASRESVLICGGPLSISPRHNCFNIRKILPRGRVADLYICPAILLRCFYCAPQELDNAWQRALITTLCLKSITPVICLILLIERQVTISRLRSRYLQYRA